MSTELEHLQRRMARMEETLFFQESTISDLNEALTQQQFQLDSLTKKLQQTLEKLDDVQSLLDQGGELTVPPHSVQKSF